MTFIKIESNLTKCNCFRGSADWNFALESLMGCQPGFEPAERQKFPLSAQSE